MPALATSTSQRPKRSRTASANAPTLSREEMSHSSPKLSPPASAMRRSVSSVGCRSAIATRWPSRASRSANAWPMLCAPPVTTATLPSASRCTG